MEPNDDAVTGSEEEVCPETSEVELCSHRKRKRQRGRRKPHSARAHDSRSLYYGTMTSGHRVWGHLVSRVETESWGCVGDRRHALLCLDLDATKHRGIEELEAGAILCKANALTVAHVSPAQSARREAAVGGLCDYVRPNTPQIGAACFISTGGPVLNAERRLDQAITAVRRELASFDHLALRAAWVACAHRMPDAQCRDSVRGNLRLGGGWAEMPTRSHRFFKGVPQEPTTKGGMWWPRVSAAHFAGLAAVNERWLPLMSRALQVVQCMPIGAGGGCSVVADLQATAGCLAYPHKVELAWTESGRPYLRSAVPEHRLAASCIHRTSFLLAEGDQANAQTAEACPTVPPSLVRSLTNGHGKNLAHLDPRDAGAWAKLLGGSAAAAAGIEIVTHRRAQPPPPGAAPDFLQTVMVIFQGCSESEALAVVGLSSEEVSGIFQAPLSGPEEICMAIYLLDFTGRYHGNPRSSTKLPPGAWAFRATPYATVHGATWAARIDKMPPAEAAALLSSLAGLPGYKPLVGRDDSSAMDDWGDDAEALMEPSRSVEASSLAQRAGSAGWVELTLESGETAVGQVQSVSDVIGPRWWVVTTSSHWYPLDPGAARVVELGRTRSRGVCG
jgi:hypothetical protein